MDVGAGANQEQQHQQEGLEVEERRLQTGLLAGIEYTLITLFLTILINLFRYCGC